MIINPPPAPLVEHLCLVCLQQREEAEQRVYDDVATSTYQTTSFPNLGQRRWIENIKHFSVVLHFLHLSPFLPLLSVIFNPYDHSGLL